MENKREYTFEMIMEWIRKYPKTAMVLGASLIVFFARLELWILLGVLVCMIYIGENDVIASEKKKLAVQDGTSG